MSTPPGSTPSGSSALDGRYWLHPDVVVQPSAIAGRGLFTGVALTAGTTVSTLGAQPVQEPDLCALTADSPVRFVNHSCDPNLSWADGYALVAVRDVGAGQELTLDYATSTADPDFLLRCHCETYRCRQMVTGDDWQIPQLQARYAGHWLPVVEHLIHA